MIKNLGLAKNIDELLNQFSKEELFQIILELKDLMLGYLGENDVRDATVYYQANYLLDEFHHFLLQKIIGEEAC